MCFFLLSIKAESMLVQNSSPFLFTTTMLLFRLFIILLFRYFFAYCLLSVCVNSFVAVLLLIFIISAACASFIFIGW